MADSKGTTRSNARYVPRISVDITPEMQTKLQKYIPHGYQRPLFNILINQIIDMIEKAGEKNAPFIIGAIIAGRIRVIDLIRNLDDGK